MSIATKRGDGGQTSMVGGVRVSKTDPRVECYGTIDELISQMGFARSICQDAEVCAGVERIQRELYKVGSAIATPPESKKSAPEITPEMVDALEAEVHRIEAVPKVLGDWSLPGGLPDAAALDVARTVCRRAERLLIGARDADEAISPEVIRYVNRLSDALFVWSRWINHALDQPEHLWNATTAPPP